MKKTLCLFVVLFATLITFAAKVPYKVDEKKADATLPSSVSTPITSTVDETAKASPTEAFRQLTISDLQKTLGRKLTIKEKVSWWLYKNKFIHIEPSEREIRNANTNAVLGFIFSLLGLFVFQLFAIPGLILSGKALNAERADPGILRPGNKGLATAGKIISIVDLVLLAIVLIIVIAVLSNFH